MDQQPSRIHRVGFDPSPSDPTSGRFVIHMGGRRSGKTFFAHQMKALQDLLDSKKGADAMSTTLHEHKVPYGTGSQRPVDVPLYARNGTFTVPVRVLPLAVRSDLGLLTAAEHPFRFLVFDRKTLFPLGAVAGSDALNYRAFFPRFSNKRPAYILQEIEITNPPTTYESESDAYRAVLGHALSFSPTVYNDNRENPNHTSHAVYPCTVCGEPMEHFALTFASDDRLFTLRVSLHMDSLDGPDANPNINPFVCVATHGHTYGPEVNGVLNTPGSHTDCPRCHRPLVLTGSALVSPRHLDTGLDACSYINVGL